MKTGKIKFEDILGNKGKIYDKWLEKQVEGYYLTYKQNFYSDQFDFSIEREGCGASEPVFLAKSIDEITNIIDKEIKIEERQQRKSELAKNPDDYILIENIKGNKDLHEIAKKIKFEDGYGYLPKTTTRKQFISEIIGEIEWQFKASSQVPTRVLYEALEEISKIQARELKKSFKER